MLSLTPTLLHEFEDIISRGMDLLSSHNNFIVSNVRRKTNKVAHNIRGENGLDRLGFVRPKPGLFQKL